MKTKQFILGILLLLIAAFPAISQTICFTGGITFYSQADLDYFGNNYQTCEVIPGNIIINDSGDNTNDIIDLSPLNNIKSIGGNLDIISNPVLSNLSGLSSLQSVVGFLRFYNLDNISDLSGLDQLSSLGGYLYISENANLMNLSGMPLLHSVGGNLFIWRCPALQNLNGLQNITSIGGHLFIGQNSSLVNLTGLEYLTSIDGWIAIMNNAALQTLSGIDNIDHNTIDHVYLVSSGVLSHCHVTSICNHLQSNGPANITGNAPGCDNITNVTSGCGTNCVPGDITLDARDYPFSINQLTEVCVGERANFAANLSGQLNGAGTPISWEINEGNGWQPLNNPPFIGYQFSAIPYSNTLDCATSTDGFIHQQYRANMFFFDATIGQYCSYTSDPYDLTLCCPISDATLTVSPEVLCEESSTTITLSLNSPDPFINAPGQYVDIKWYDHNNIHMGSANDNQTTINYNLTTPTVTTPTDFCFTAKVTNCANKERAFSACITVDPQPVCGTIISYATNLNPIPSSTHLTYEICPGNDAAIGEGTSFVDCNRSWQYSFDGITWIDEGSSSNPVLNTNTLPWDFNWPANITSIFYRIECKPLSTPSGCTPCYSDPIEIQLKPAPSPDFINGPNQVCIENLPTTLTVNNYNPAYDYTWYCDGLAVWNGPSHTTYKDKSACFEVEIFNGCETITTPLHCLEVCEIIPIISCPLPPNEGACPGKPITLSACNTQFNCEDIDDLIFIWTIDGGTPQQSPSCLITHTPLLSGSTYELTVKHPLTGCEAFTSTTITPCK